MTAEACAVAGPMRRRNRVFPVGDYLGSQRDALRGSIVEFERLAVHDGPGIRTVIFFKGCPLRCLWCSSPESHARGPETGYDQRKCVRCMMCLEACPRNAIYLSNTGTIKTNRHKCDNCGECVNACFYNARRMLGREIHVSEALNEIAKDEVFYYRSGGGVTLSGGEPTMQPEFAKAVLKSCLNRGINTAMETCGYTRWDILEIFLDCLDLIYFDIKHMNATVHEELTGVNNQLILENIRKINDDSRGISIIIRVPVIPGINDSAENMHHTARFLRQLHKVQRIELLPYHRYGVSSYGVLERAYRLPKVMIPSHDHMLQIKNIFKSHGITAQIGG